MRKVAINLCLSLTAVLLSLALIEVGLRLFLPTGPRSGYLVPKASRQQLTPRTAVFEPNYSGTLIGRDFKTTYRVNSLGFREREVDVTRLSAQQPYLFVGDSYFNGWGVNIDARVSERLSEKLRRRDLPIPIVNFALPGYGTYQYLDILKAYGVALNARLAVIGFFVGNDFIDDVNTLRSEEHSRVERKHSVGLHSFDLHDLTRFVLRNSEVANLAKYALWEVPAFRHAFDRLELKNDRITLYESRSSPVQAKLYNATFAAFEEIEAFSKASHIPVLVVIIPDHIQVLRRDLFFGYERDKPQRRLKKHLDALGIVYIDLLEHFVRSANYQDLFFREDKHWSAEGHEFVAEIILEEMVRRMAGGPLLERHVSLTEGGMR